MAFSSKTCNAPGEVRLTAVNASLHVAVLAYISDNSEPRTYATLLPGSSYPQRTFYGHRWRLSCAEAPALSAEIVMPAKAAELRVDEPVPTQLEQSLNQNLSGGIPGLLNQLEMADVQAPLFAEANEGQDLRRARRSQRLRDIRRLEHRGRHWQLGEPPDLRVQPEAPPLSW